MSLRAFFGWCLALIIWLSATLSHAQNPRSEYIDRMDVTVTVLKDGSIKIREEIDYYKPPNLSKRGIFRELPRTVLDGNIKVVKPYNLTLATRNGRVETVRTTKDTSIVQWRLGQASVFLEDGLHRYVLEYESDDWIVRSSDFDEIRWNVLGEYWSFPVRSVSGQIVLPQGATPKQFAGYTGRYGSKQNDVTFDVDGNRVKFQSSRSMRSNEAVTIAVGVEKGVFDPLSGSEKRERWWRQNGAIAGLAGLLPAIFGFFFFHWSRVGRDPAKPPVFARYEAPKAYSAAAGHRILHDGCLLYTSPSPRDKRQSRMPSSA